MSKTPSSVTAAQRRVLPGVLVAALDAIDHGVLLLDRERRVCSHNRAFRQLWQVDEQDLAGYPTLAQLMRQLRDKAPEAGSAVQWRAFEQAQLDALAQDQPAPIELPLGSSLTVRFQCTPLPDDLHMLTYVDTSARRRVEQDLRSSEERYDFALQAVNEGVYDWNIESDHLYCSPRVYPLLNIAADSLTTGQQWLQRVHPQDLESYLQTFTAHLKGEQARFEAEFRFRSDDGTWHWAQQHGLALRDAGGRAYRMIGSAGDITAQKTYEQALAEKSDTLEATFDNMTQGICIFDADLNALAFNRRFTEILDYPPDRFKPGDSLEAFLRYAAARGEYGTGDPEQMIQQRLQMARSNEVHHFERTRANGTIIETHGTPLPGGGFIATYTDITERKRTELVLQAVIDAVPAMISAKDEQFRYVLMNNYQARLYGVDAAQAIGRTAGDLLGEAYGERTQKLDRRVLQRGETIPYYEEQFTDAGGRHYTLLTTKVPLRDAGGNIYGIATIALDISVRKRAELQLRESEERFRAVAHSASDPIVSSDAAGKIIAWNRAAQATFGYRENEVLGESLQMLMPQAYRQRHSEAMQRLSAGGAPRVLGKTLEVHGLRKDGSEFPLELSLSKWTLAGEPYYTGIIRDITDRRRAERTLRDSEERYALATQAATEGIYEWNITHDTLYLSERAKQLFDFAERELTAPMWTARVHPDDVEDYRRAIVDLFKQCTEQLECEYRVRDMQGHYHWVLDRACVVRADSGRATRMVGALTDITSRKQTLIDLRQAKEQAEAATVAKSRFLANMSHELRTPLNAEIGITEMLLEDVEEQRIAEFEDPLQRVCRAGRNLLHLITELLDLSKIEAGKMELLIDAFEIASLLDETVLDAQPLAERNGNRIVVHYPEDIGSMRADPMRVQQVMLNLLSNACKFSENGTITVRAVREFYGEREWFKLTVADRGIGIAQEELASLFDEFTQAAPRRDKRYGGTGLGLAISRRFCRLMGGDITVESEPDRGTTCTVWLPVEVEVVHAAP